MPPKAKPKTKPKPAAIAPDDGEDGGQEEPEEEEDPAAEMTTKSGIRWSDGCFGHGCFSHWSCSFGRKTFDLSPTLGGKNELIGSDAVAGCKKDISHSRSST